MFRNISRLFTCTSCPVVCGHVAFVAQPDCVVLVFCMRFDPREGHAFVNPFPDISPMFSFACVWRSTCFGRLFKNHQTLRVLPVCTSVLSTNRGLFVLCNVRTCDESEHDGHCALVERVVEGEVVGHVLKHFGARWNEKTDCHGRHLVVRRTPATATPKARQKVEGARLH